MAIFVDNLHNKNQNTPTGFLPGYRVLNQGSYISQPSLSHHCANIEDVVEKSSSPPLRHHHSPSSPVSFAPLPELHCTSAGNIVLVQKLSHLLLGLDLARSLPQVDPAECLDVWAVALQDSSHVHRALPDSMQGPAKRGEIWD